MKVRLTMLLACLFLCLGGAFAQTQVSGTVVSQDDGLPVIGATVQVPGTNVGAVTDADGKFSLTLPQGSNILRISYVGMEPIEVSARRNMRIELRSDIGSLDEVIVVAYGTAKKSSFTGSASQVNSEEIGKVQVSNAVEAITGKVSGVQINNPTGQPGQTDDNFSIRIRGISSINASNSPLVVLDGAPYDGDLNNLNTQDIESMTVLKDAAAAALYGARGANGVILITTKKGRGGTSSITVDAKWGSNSRAVPTYEYIDSPARYYEMWYQALNNYAKNTWNYSDLQAMQFANNNLTGNNSYGLGYNVYTVPDGQYLIGANGKLNPNATLGRSFNYRGTDYYLTPDDWEDLAYRNALRQEYSVSANGSNDKSSFYASFNYLNNEGITLNSDYERITGRLKADYQIKPWLKVLGNMSYAHYKANRLNEDGSDVSSGNLFAVTRVAPIYPAYIRDANGNVIQDVNTGIALYDYGDGKINGQQRPFMAQANPLSANQLDDNSYEGNFFSAVGTAELTFLKDFKFTTQNSANVNETRETNTTNAFYGSYASSNGMVYKYHTRRWSYNFLQQLDWHHLFGKHDLQAMLAHEAYRSRYYYLYGYKTNQFSPDNVELSGAVKDGASNSYVTDYNTEGYLGRFQYNYDETYFASVSFRRDASSRFHKDHRWGTFWSASAAWLINKEKWFNAEWVDELKLKASYGEQGNDNIGTYRYTNYYSIQSATGAVSLIPDAKGNEEISWEKQGNFNIGVDFSFFRGRLSGTVEYFNRKTKDMLAWFPLPASFGYTGYYANIGDMVNKGVEVELNGDIIRTKELTWSARLNMTAYKNKISYLPDERKTYWIDGVPGYSSGNFFYGEGESMYTWYMPRYAGVDPETGKALYWNDVYKKNADGTGYELDANGQPIVESQEKIEKASEATRHLCGSPLPDVYGGFGTSLSWKGFDFSMDFQYQLGGKVYDSDYQSSMGNQRGHAMHVDLEKSWTPENPNTDIPRLQFADSYANSTSDRWLVSGSYLKLQNITIGYTLPMKWTSKIGISKMRIYGVADNVWVWSKRQGLDPSRSFTGEMTSAYYSPIRTISGGVTLTF